MAAVGGRVGQSIDTAKKRAAVAAIVNFGGGEGPRVLLIRRAQREGDKWSGHISLPGGREHPGDADLVTTAMRETREEVGVDLRRETQFVGALDAMVAIADGRRTDLAIYPFVFTQTDAVKLVLNHEAERAFWLPLGSAASGQFDKPFHYNHEGARLTLPSWHYDSEVIWGLTHRILSNLLSAVTST